MRISDWSSDVCSSDLFGLALRMVVLAFLLFAPLAAAWMMLAESTAYLFAGSGGLGAALAWVPAIAVYAVLFGLMLGALPALCIEYFLCRRFLRQAERKSTRLNSSH